MVHWGVTVPEFAPWYDERGEAATLLVKFHLVVASVGIGYRFEEVFGDS